MDLTRKQSKQKVYQCAECNLHYLDKIKAEECEAWCREYKSCNLEIIKHAVEQENSQD